MFVGAKHDRIQYEIITNNLSAVMLRPLQKPDAPFKCAMHSPHPTLYLEYNFFMVYKASLNLRNY